MVSLAPPQFSITLRKDVGFKLPLEFPEGLVGKMQPEDWKESATKTNKIVDAVTCNGVGLGILSFGQTAAWGLYDGFTQSKRRIEKEVTFVGYSHLVNIIQNGKLFVTGAPKYCGVTIVLTPSGPNL